MFKKESQINIFMIKSVFQDIRISVEVVGNIVIKSTSKHKVKPKEKKPRVLALPSLDLEVPWDFFDGAIQGHPHVCGA
jgi:hypothetical protein